MDRDRLGDAVLPGSDEWKTDREGPPHRQPIEGREIRIATFDLPAPRRSRRAIGLALAPTLTPEGSEALLRASEPRLALTNPASIDRARAELAPGAPFARLNLVAPVAPRP